MSRALVETRNLGREFHQHRRLFQRRAGPVTVALEHVSMQVDAGQCLAITGPNGAGKSTLLRILATLISPSQGTAFVRGHDVRERPGDVRSLVGFTGNAERTFFWPLTGLENLVFFGQIAGLRKRDAEQAARERLARVGLDAAADRRVSGYSAGMRQRLGLARALLHRPAVLLLDEPTASLDAEYRDVARDIIRDAVADGERAVIVATHDPGLVAACADVTLRLEHGRIVEQGPAARAVTYRVRVLDNGRVDRAGVTTIDVEDLGDGHALSSALASAISEGKEVVGVEPVTARRAAP